MKYLNLGCGVRFDKNWINVDMNPQASTIIKCNFLNGIPFEDNYFDVVYHSHVLEHFQRKSGNFFIGECYRILKPNGIIRIVVPDLERIANEYLFSLKEALNGSVENEKNYDWIMLELYDQTVRNKSGGEMGEYLTNSPENMAYVEKRIGDLRKNNSHIVSEDFRTKIKKVTSSNNILKKVKEKLVFLALSKRDKEALRIGRFRLGGEIHQWMYDRFSLTRILKEKKFKDIVLRTATESYINNWSDFKLDNPDEEASIYIEGIK